MNIYSKIRAFMAIVRHGIGAGLASMALLLPAGAQAELADRSQPLQIEADSLVHDEKKQITTAQGRVVASQGSLQLRAGRVVVRQLPRGHHAVELSAAGGPQVYMRQKRQGLNEYIEGYANHMQRNDATGITRLSGNARMRRLVGGVLADEVVGDAISYNEKTEVYRLTGGASTSTAQPGGVPAGRVRVYIAPADRTATSSPRNQHQSATARAQAANAASVRATDAASWPDASHPADWPAWPETWPGDEPIWPDTGTPPPVPTPVQPAESAPARTPDTAQQAPQRGLHHE